LEVPSLQGIEKRFLPEIYCPTLKELKLGSQFDAPKKFPSTLILI
jgi:hypothetical protein